MTQNTLNKNLEYKDVASEWLNRKHKNGKVLDSYYYITNNKVYIVDGSKKVVLDYSLKELEMANWLVNTFGETLYMKPRVNQPDGIKTADYFWKGEYWDLKSMSATGKRAFDNRINNHETQSKNFIFDVTCNPLSNKEIEKQIINIYKSESRNWINKIIVKRNNKIVFIFERKKRLTTQPAAKDQSHD